MVSSRRSSNHGKEEEKEENGPETTDPLGPWATDRLRHNRRHRYCILSPQFGRVRREKQSVKLFKALIE